MTFNFPQHGDTSSEAQAFRLRAVQNHRCPNCMAPAGDACRSVQGVPYNPKLSVHSRRLQREAGKGNMMDQLLPLPATRRDDHDTSKAAAQFIKPVTGKIALEVLSFAKQRADFTDDDLKVAYPTAAESSHRKRRKELVELRMIEPVDGALRRNRRGRFEQVYRITDKGRAQ